VNRIEPTFDTDAMEIDLSNTVIEHPKKTNENELRIHNKLADVWQREVAQTIDFLISFTIFSICLYITKELQVNNLYSDIIIILFPSIYFVFSDGLAKGQSFGKRLFNISVINKNTGEYCSFTRSFVRNIFTPITGVLDIMVILIKKRRRLGDLFAGTMVVKNS